MNQKWVADREVYSNLDRAWCVCAMVCAHKESGCPPPLETWLHFPAGAPPAWPLVPKDYEWLCSWVGSHWGTVSLSPRPWLLQTHSVRSAAWFLSSSSEKGRKKVNKRRWQLLSEIRPICQVCIHLENFLSPRKKEFISSLFSLCGYEFERHIEPGYIHKSCISMFNIKHIRNKTNVS